MVLGSWAWIYFSIGVVSQLMEMNIPWSVNSGNDAWLAGKLPPWLVRGLPQPHLMTPMGITLWSTNIANWKITIYNW